MSYNTILHTQRVDTLQQGQTFVKVRHGLPCLTLFVHVNTFDTVTEAESLDGDTRYLKNETLVYLFEQDIYKVK